MPTTKKTRPTLYITVTEGDKFVTAFYPAQLDIVGAKAKITQYYDGKRRQYTFPLDGRYAFQVRGESY